MGNYQEKEVDVLEAFIDIQDEIFHYNSSVCEEIWKNILAQNSSTLQNSTDNQQDYNFTNFIDKCLNRTLPEDLFSQPYILPWYQQLGWSLIFAVMILIAIVGNLIVIWIITAHKRMRTVTNLFLLNLAIADFLLASGNAAFNFVFMLNSHWPFGRTFCIISNFLASLTVSTSVFTILSLSLDSLGSLHGERGSMQRSKAHEMLLSYLIRFVAVARPLRPKMTKKVAVSIILLVWSLSSVISFPPLLYATTITYKYSDEQQRTLCFLLWPDTIEGISYLDHVYNIVFLVVTYVVPMGCMAVTYTWIGCILWGSKVIGENTDLQNQVVKSKQKVVHMLVAVMLLFAICWLPYHIYFLYTYYNRDVLHTHFIQHVYLAIYWLAMSNSCYNPIVYYIMNARFRGYFQKVLCIHSSKETANVIHYDEAHKSLPLTARISMMTSNRTRSSRMSFPRRKSDRNLMNDKNVAIAQL